MSAPKNNRNATKPAADKVASPVIVRGTEAERKAWKQASTGHKFNNWARTALNQATK